MVGKHMSPELFMSILRQATLLGATCVELTGGGEPLEHPRAVDLLTMAAAHRTSSLRVGVLSNGAPFEEGGDPHLLDALVRLDYVRLGWTEQYDRARDRYEQRFHSAIRTIGEHRERVVESTLRLGVKLLLTSSNASGLVPMISSLLDLQTTTGRPVVDHVKVKAIRGEDIEPTDEQVRDFEHAMVTLKTRVGSRAGDVQVDVKSARVEDGYKCWISPLMTVIDAAGSVYLCCNFYEDPEASKIGDLGVDGGRDLREFWGGDEHLAVIRQMNAESVCNSPLGCHCRLVRCQRMVEPQLQRRAESDIASTPLFPGHESTS